MHSEALFDLATNEWLALAPTTSNALNRLAKLLQIDHRDAWLREYLKARSYPQATQSLLEAINANKKGDLDGAIRAASEADRLFRLTGNQPGRMRAQFERIYSLRRKSEGQACARESSSLEESARQTSYSWLRIQVSLERSSCLAMLGKFDAAWTTAMHAALIADQTKYRSLRLRALGLEASLHTNEGRLRQAWSSTTTGLHLFFAEPYPPERGFQFFSELEFAAEEEAHWHLAALLQNEAIVYIRSLGRLDFEATAHFHLAAVEKALGNVENAKTEILAAQQLFEHLPAGPSRDFLEAESRIAMAALEARFGSPASAAAYLAGLDSIVSNTDNFTVHLSYEQALADVQGRLGNQDEEVKHLRRCVEIGNQGFSSLSSPRDRWEWEQTVGQAYRRLLEIQLSSPHDPAEALASWETYKMTALMRNARLPISRTSSEQHRLLKQISTLRDSTAVIFAQISDTTVAWVADDRGIHEIKLALKNKDLAPLVRTFYRLCSDPTSPVEKVKSAGSRLYELLLSPLDQEFGLRRTLFIESDGAFGMMPWAALTTQDGSYLGTRFQIINMPGLIFRGFPTAESREKGPAVIAYPGLVTLGSEQYPSLPHAQAEAATLAQMLENSFYLEGGKATTARLAELLPHASLFHFAGHAVTREFGGELLVQGTHGGELFSASTISLLDLTGLRLAVLAACNTGTGLEVARNPNGLVGAFIRSGTYRVLASNWTVDSKATSELMSDFYVALGERSKERSIEEAWRVAVSKDSTSHPYYWAGFQVFGSPD